MQRVAVDDPFEAGVGVGIGIGIGAKDTIFVNELKPMTLGRGEG